MARSSKRKGDGFEREIVNALRADGLDAGRVPLSGAMGGKYRGDIKLMVMGIEQSLECKRRARAFASLAAWLGQNYALVIRDDRCEPMVVMSLRDWTNLIRSNGQHVAAGEEKL